MTNRTERIGRLMQEKIGALIVEGRIKDPRVNPFLSVTRVSVSRDLAWAEVYISTFKPEANLAKGVEGLQSAAGFIQSQLASLMKLRQTPRLRFHDDLSIKEGFEIVKKIEDLNHGHAEGQ
ncbi:30S ribosome-binding factor RbfA [Leadbettera azotonutricia]|uniref:Ribosome-binding factor A n=1 Tax=Leadbettera azotonutricia (strain ATCC BAA-888 / DSM 13862 / ZAS-9) TaxID=545695 RepID=F5YBN2_LEAAZ|nr:30S ribosome-binding factor RbfA [Leadbettera azotonutricia]AEF81127.1 ribosome-binding factor A [Leadbettera azotonutricia ZAS-9]